MLLPSLGWEDPLEDKMSTDSQYSCWENPMNRGSWRTTVHRGRKESDKTEVTEHACMHDLRFTLNVIECRRF